MYIRSLLASEPWNQIPRWNHGSPEVGHGVRGEEVDDVHGSLGQATLVALVDKGPRRVVCTVVGDRLGVLAIQHGPALGHPVVLALPPRRVLPNFSVIVLHGLEELGISPSLGCTIHAAGADGICRENPQIR